MLRNYCIVKMNIQSSYLVYLILFTTYGSNLSKNMQRKWRCIGKTFLGCQCSSVVRCMPSMCKDLGLITSTTKKKNSFSFLNYDLKTHTEIQGKNRSYSGERETLVAGQGWGHGQEAASAPRDTWLADPLLCGHHYCRFILTWKTHTISTYPSPHHSHTRTVWHHGSLCCFPFVTSSEKIGANDPYFRELRKQMTETQPAWRD